jgi:hypothetical protein
MEYEVYRHVDASDEDFEYIDRFFKQVLKEDKHLCNAAQKNLNSGVFVNGQMHPDLESAPLFFQSVVKSLLVEHRKLETEEGKPIWPAARQMQSRKTQEEDDFCSGLACNPSLQVQAEW